MGRSIFSSSSVGVRQKSSSIEAERNETSKNAVVIDNFTIVETVQCGSTLIALVRYPNCSTHGGLKLMVYRNTSRRAFHQRKSIDPHFLEKDGSPFARFEPTVDGMTAAKHLALYLESSQS